MLFVLILLSVIRILDMFAWAPESYPDIAKIILISRSFEFLSFLALLFLMLYSYLWAIKKKYTSLLIVLIIVFAFFGPVLIRLLTAWLEITFWRADIVEPFTLDLIKKYAPGCMLVILFLSATFYLTHLKLLFDKQRETAHKAETLAKDMQLKMLRYQINPHFLFNVLNSIHALIDEDTENAKKLVVEMSEYYRYTLNKQQQTISIEKEVESITKYLEIQKIRFEEKFAYEISIDQNLSAVLIPSFIIHLLIENAVKFGRKSNEQKLVIRLSVKSFDDLLVIKVSNTGKLVKSAPQNENNNDGTGSGIENIKSRLALFYDDNYSFSLTEEDNMVVAAIEIKNISTK